MKEEKFEDSEFEYLLKITNDNSWHNFILECAKLEELKAQLKGDEK